MIITSQEVIMAEYDAILGQSDRENSIITWVIILKLDKARAWRKPRVLWSYNELELTNHSALN